MGDGGDEGDEGDVGDVAVVDVHYLENGGARASAVALPAWSSACDDAVSIRTSLSSHAEPYVPGRFFERELGPIAGVLAQSAGCSAVIIDGYVDLDPDGRPGLGRVLRDTLGLPVVVGVAKSPFRGATHARPVLRGASGKPLFVTAIGIRLGEAVLGVESMAGRFRLPDAIRLADRVARTGDHRLRVSAQGVLR